MRSRLLPLAWGLALCSCATATPSTWFKPGADEAELARDRYTCTQQARAKNSVVVDDAMMANIQRTPLFTLCMQARGWVASERTKL